MKYAEVVAKAQRERKKHTDMEEFSMYLVAFGKMGIKLIFGHIGRVFN